MELTKYELQTVKDLIDWLQRLTESSGERLQEISVEATLGNGDRVKVGFGEGPGPALLWVYNTGS